MRSVTARLTTWSPIFQTTQSIGLTKEVERQTHSLLSWLGLSRGPSNPPWRLAVRPLWVNICSRICADCIFGRGGSVVVTTIARMEEEGVGVWIVAWKSGEE